MKRCILFFSFICLISVNQSISAQEASDSSVQLPVNYLERSPIYDYGTLQLENTYTLPDYDTKANKLKISGTIYESDGVTPAKDVILYIDQADEHGDFDLREDNEKRYVHHRGWIKTGADGKYTFYTFIPGNDRRYNQLQQIFPIIKESSKTEYEIASFLFDDDPLLSKLCRKRMTKKGDPTRILKPIQKDGLLVVEKDIILNTNTNIFK